MAPLAHPSEPRADVRRWLAEDERRVLHLEGGVVRVAVLLAAALVALALAF